MDPLKQRIAIAEHCGWTKFPGRVRWESTPWGVPPKGDPRFDWECTPDYLNDLNAMHEAISGQPNEIQWAIFTELAAIVTADIPAAFGVASEYAEAFLRAIGKWEDEKLSISLPQSASSSVRPAAEEGRRG